MASLQWGLLGTSLNSGASLLSSLVRLFARRNPRMKIRQPDFYSIAEFSLTASVSVTANDAASGASNRMSRRDTWILTSLTASKTHYLCIEQALVVL